MQFKELNIIQPILKALANERYINPTPIQEQAIPVVLDRKDLLGCAQTGTGKTAAFAIPLLQLIYNEKQQKGKHNNHCLILTPTRELAVQIGESFHAYGRYTGLRHTVIYGGVSQRPQTTALQSGVEIIIATPGRLLDLINQGYVRLDRTEFFVLDEADRMLDMGFITDIQKIIQHLPEKHQTLFFCATMPAEIAKLARNILTHPVQIAVTPVSSTSESIEQAIYFVDQHNKKTLLIHLLNSERIDTALVFTRTKHGADKVSKELNRAGIHAVAIHGNKSQHARQRALNDFKLRRIRVLVATDIAARGIDVEELSHVINYEIPNVAETYVHRIGRTGRAGLGGIALSFCDRSEKSYLKDIHKLLSKSIPVITDHPFPAAGVEDNDAVSVPAQRDRSRPSGTFRKNYQQRRRWDKRRR